MLTGGVKAAATHEKMAELASEAMNEIGNAVERCTRGVGHFAGAQMQAAAAHVYGQIFQLLKTVFCCYSKSRWKHFRHAFNESAPDEFRADIQRLRRASDSFTDRVDSAALTENRVTNLLTHQLAAGQLKLHAGLQQQQQTLNVIEQRLLVLGGFTRDSCIDQARHYIDTRPLENKPDCRMVNDVDRESNIEEGSGTSPRKPLSTPTRDESDVTRNTKNGHKGHSYGVDAASTTILG
jgi:hypothetical protein